MVYRMAIQSYFEKDKYLQLLCVDFHKSAKWLFTGTHRSCKYLSFSKSLTDYTKSQTESEAFQAHCQTK